MDEASTKDGGVAAQMPAMLGGRYRLLSVLGQGGMTTVYRARDDVLGRSVAVKAFRTDSSDDADPGALERRRTEMQLLASLSHPGLVTLHDAGIDASPGPGSGPVQFLVMELVTGSDLSARLHDGPLANGQARLLGADVAAALQYIHSRGIVHRDVKPGNILLPLGWEQGSAGAKLTDFGIARLAEASRLTMANATVGTAAYLSPEQAQGHDVGPPTDVYALGLVLLECLTGRPEFPGPALEAAAARLSRDPRIPEELGAPWGSLLPAMTAREPGNRPDAGAVARLLRQPAPSSVPGEAPATQVLPAPAPRVHGRQSPGQRPTVLPRPATGQLTNSTLRFTPAPPPPGRAPGAPAEPRSAARGTVRRRPSRRLALWVSLALVLAAGVILAIALATAPPSSTPSAPAPSPTLTGPLEDHLRQLEESVRP